MNVLGASIFSVIVITLGLLTGFITNKIYAVYLGEEGIVAINNLSNIINFALIFATGGILSGITQLVSHKQILWERQKKIIITFILCVSIAVTIVMITFTTAISPFILSEHVNYYALEKALLITFISLPFIVYTQIVEYSLVGYKRVKAYSYLKIFGHITNILGTFILVNLWGLEGALVSLVIPGLLSMLIIKRYIKSYDLLPILAISFNKVKQSLPVLRHLWHFAIAAASGNIMIYASHFLIRNYIQWEYSLEDAAYWQAVTTLSRAWMSFPLYVIFTYFFAEFASAQSKKETIHHILSFVKYIYPIMIWGFLIIYGIKEIIIVMVFSKSFLPSVYFLPYQMVGDLLKLGGVIISYYLLGRNYLKAFITTYAIHYLGFIVFAITLSMLSGKVEGIFLGYISASLLYLISSIIIFVKVK